MAVKITSAQDLASMQNGGEYELDGDIALTAPWKTLEGKKSITIYGNGHKITGLTNPIFGNVAHSKIMHLRIECDMQENGSRNIGAICRYGLQLTLTGCTISGYVGGSKYVGGLAGDLSQSSVTSCTNIAHIKGEEYVGGMCGCVSHSSVTGCNNSGAIRAIGRALYGGGIIGYAMDQSYIADNLNEGSLSDYHFHGCGGIAGGIREVRVFQGNVNKGIINGMRFVGGIVGIADESAIMNNENLMPVNGLADNIGGIVGYAFTQPLLVRENVNAGAVDGERENVGGIVGCAGEGAVIVDNTVSSPSIRGNGNVARVLGKAHGAVYLNNTRVYANCLIKGGSHARGIYDDQIVMPDDPNLGANELMGASFIPPDGFKPAGMRMHLEPTEVIADDRDDAAKAASTIAAGIKVLSSSFQQITTALSMGLTALSRVFQADAEYIKPLLRQEKEAIRTLRLLNTALGSYVEFMDRMEEQADAETPEERLATDAENPYGAPLLTAHINRVVLRMVAENTQQPLAGARIKLHGKGAELTFVSDVEGRVVLEKLPEGEYEVTEQTAPAGYLKDSAVHRLKASADGTVAWDGRLGLRWNNEIIVTVPQSRDDSALFLSGEAWAARPEAYALGIPPTEEKPLAQAGREAAVQSVHVEATEQGQSPNDNELEPDAEARELAMSALETMLAGDTAQNGAQETEELIQNAKKGADA
ncbi:MAG: prealbumin-like fold domain-containing protein [Oscillospiraceae bacterium]|jgi:hypothetical protein|nr:prealbumin-like fold domain-containing protein [Oscillospiraceae bacterium]